MRKVVFADVCSQAMSIACIVNWACNFLVGLLFPYMQAALGTHIYLEKHCLFKPKIPRPVELWSLRVSFGSYVRVHHVLPAGDARKINRRNSGTRNSQNVRRPKCVIFTVYFAAFGGRRRRRGNFSRTHPGSRVLRF
jgi:hypothetical protein